MSRNFNVIPVTLYDNLLKYELTPEQSLVHLFLLTCRHTTSIGAFTIHPDTIAFYTSLTPDQIPPILASLETRELVFRFPGDWTFVLFRWLCEPTKNSKTFKGAYLEYLKLPDPIKAAVRFHHPDIVTEARLIEEHELHQTTRKITEAFDNPEPSDFDYSIQPDFTPKKRRNPLHN